MGGGTCAATGMCPGGTAALSCLSGSDCGSGDVCCAKFSGLTGVSATCEATCGGMGMGGGGMGGGGMGGGFELCSSDSQCPNGEVCRPALDGLSACARPHGGMGGSGTGSASGSGSATGTGSGSDSGSGSGSATGSGTGSGSASSTGSGSSS
jgi:Cys-rich repeat protein